MSKHRVTFGVSAGMVSLVVDGLVGISLIPLLFEYLQPSQAGFWTLVTTTGALLMLLPNSLALAVSRMIAQANGMRGIEGVAELNGQVRSAVRCAQFALLLISLLLLIGVLIPAGIRDGLTYSGSIAWLFYVVGLLFAFEAYGHIACLNGIGQVGWDKLIRVVTSLFGLAGSWIGLRQGWGMIGLGIVFMAQSLILLILVLSICKNKVLKHFAIFGAITPPVQMLSEIGRLLLLGGGGYIVVNSGTFIIERLFGLADVARYNAFLRVGMMLSSVSLLYPQMAYPYVAQAWAVRDFPKVKGLYLRGIGIAVGSCLMGSAVIWLLADWLFPIWLGQSNYLGSSILLLTLLYQTISVHHVAHSTPVMAAIGNAFVGPVMISVVLVPALVVIASRSYGIAGVPVGTILGILPGSVWVVVRCWQIMQRT
jgi:O-antigen/teichoic acid export membrane protein